MASYFVPTVVQTTISNPDMTPLERLVLSHIFEAEPDGDGLYFFAEESPAECIEVDAADAIRSCATDEMIAQFRDEAAAAAAPSSHVLLRFDEAEVRTMIGEIIAFDGALTRLSPDAVSDDDIHAASLAAVTATDLAEERGSALFKAALGAIGNAERRLAEEQKEGRKEEE